MNKLDTHSRIRKPRVPEGCSRSFNKEKTVIKNLIGQFDPTGSLGERIINSIMGCPINDVSQESINNLAIIFSLMIHTKYTRNHKRSKPLAIKWFDENSELIMPFINSVKVEYAK